MRREHPSTRLLAGGCLIAGVVGVAIMVPHVGLGHAGVFAGAATVITLYVISLVTRPWAVALPRGLVTVGDLTLAAVPPGYEAVATQRMTDEEVWERLQKSTRSRAFGRGSSGTAD